MKRVLGITVAAVVLASAAACGIEKSDPTPVTVVSKEIEPAEWENKKVRECKGYKTDKSGKKTCSRWGTKTVKEFDDQDFVLHLSNGEEVDVPETEYNNWQEGQVYRD